MLLTPLPPRVIRVILAHVSIGFSVHPASGTNVVGEGERWRRSANDTNDLDHMHPGR